MDDSVTARTMQRIREEWEAPLKAEIERLREWIDTEGRNCPSNATVDAVLHGSPAFPRKEHDA